MSAPKREVFANNATTTLNGTINDLVTSLTVTDGSAFPSMGNFRIRIDSEIMHCTGRSGNTLTVNRAIESTTAASHLNGATVSHILTSESLLRNGQDNDALWGCTSRPAFGIYDASGNIINSSDFTVVNQNSTTITDLFGTISLNKPNNTLSNQNCTLLVRSATVPFTQIMCMKFSSCVGNIADNIFAGICIRDSSTGKFIAWCIDDIYNSSRLRRRVAAWRFTDATTYSGAASLDALEYTVPDPIWLKVEVSTTTVTYSISTDGIDWQSVKNEVDNAFISDGAIDQVGIVVNSINTNFRTLARVLHWSAE